MQASNWTGTVDSPTLILRMIYPCWARTAREAGKVRLPISAEKSTTMHIGDQMIKNSRWLRGSHYLSSVIVWGRDADADVKTNKCEIAGQSQSTSSFVCMLQSSSQWQCTLLKRAKCQPVLPGRWASSINAAFKG